MNKKNRTTSAAAFAAAIVLAGCSDVSSGGMPGMNHGGSGMSSSSATATGSPPVTAPAGPAPEQVRPPNDENVPLTLGIAAALLALGGGIFYLAQRRARNTGS